MAGRSAGRRIHGDGGFQRRPTSREGRVLPKVPRGRTLAVRPKAKPRRANRPRRGIAPLTPH